MSKGWSLIASKIDMDTPGEVNRYFGCDHRVSYNVKRAVKIILMPTFLTSP